MIDLHFKRKYHADQLSLPHYCAVCDSENADPINYVQGHFPIPIPGFGGIYTQTHVAIPYCQRHADAFHFRFRVLTVVQYVVIAIAIACFYWGFFLLDQQGGNNSSLNPQLVVGYFCFLIVLPGSLLARRWMYDAFFVVRPGMVEVKSKYSRFLERITEANPWPGEDRSTTA